MLGRDAVLRVDMTFIPAEWARAILHPGWLAPDDARMQHLFGWNAGHNAWPLLLNEVELSDAEHILTIGRPHARPGGGVTPAPA